MYFNVASNFYYDFLKLSQKRSWENISLLYLIYIKLHEGVIKIMAAILSLEVSLSSRYNFESKYVAISLGDKLLQNFSRVLNCKLESCSARYWRSCDHIR